MTDQAKLKLPMEKFYKQVNGREAIPKEHPQKKFHF